MNLVRLLLVLFVFAPGATAADPLAGFQGAANGALPPHPSLYSFADVYRLTVGAAAVGGYPLGDGGAVESPVRVAVAQSQPAAELRFSVSRVAQPGKWMLFLAGLALAGWVAHRRLVHSY
jgi:hypothetical protein